MKTYTIKVDPDSRIKIKVNAFKCLRCGHEWIPRVELSELKEDIKELPKICPKCKTAYWYSHKKNKDKEKK